MEYQKQTDLSEQESKKQDHKLQQLARKKLNQSNGVVVGIDLGFDKDIQVNHIPLVPETILKDILSEIDPIDIVSHQSFTSFHLK